MDVQKITPMGNRSVEEVLREERSGQALLITALGHFKTSYASIFFRAHHVKEFKDNIQRYIVFCGLQPQDHQFAPHYEGPFGSSKTDEIVDKFCTQFLTVEDKGLDLIVAGILSDENIVRCSSVLLFNRLLNPDRKYKAVWFGSQVADEEL